MKKYQSSTNPNNSQKHNSKSRIHKHQCNKYHKIKMRKLHSNSNHLSNQQPEKIIILIDKYLDIINYCFLPFSDFLSIFFYSEERSRSIFINMFDSLSFCLYHQDFFHVLRRLFLFHRLISLFWTPPLIIYLTWHKLKNTYLQVLL